MGYEVDFLPVGNRGPGGDAIALRLGELRNGTRDDQFVAIVDGGFRSNGNALIAHVRDLYGTDVVDVVLSTHLDRDHIQGLQAVVENMQVRQLWMHEPTTQHREETLRAATEARGSRQERLQRVTASMNDSRDLASLARERGVEIIAPYAGLSAANGAFQVIGPTEAYYQDLLPQFRSYRGRESLAAMIGEGLERKTGKPLRETMEYETLEEGAETEPENNSSVISLLRVDERAVILTGDAGEDALHRAADYLDECRFDWKALRAMQVPHHGSRKNVTPSLLDRYLGPKPQTTRSKQAYISCSIDGEPLHPARRVTNAFYRRGCSVYKTAGRTKRLHYEAPDRAGYVQADEVPFYEEVD